MTTKTKNDKEKRKGRYIFVFDVIRGLLSAGVRLNYLQLFHNTMAQVTVVRVGHRSTIIAIGVRPYKNE